MERQRRKVIHVHLKEPYKLKQDYYFGSVAAIYEVLPKEVVGISKESLWNALNAHEYNGRKATIRQGVIISKQTGRGIRKEDKQ